MPRFCVFLSLVAVGALLLPAAGSSYFLDDGSGCNEYDPDRALYYFCTPDQATLYTPEGEDPGSYYATSNNGYDPYVGGRPDQEEPGGWSIPNPAPYNGGRFYCSRPWVGTSPYENNWNYGCYRHDVCYGSQLGRKYCDVRFWKDMANVCRSNFGEFDPRRYGCLADAREWYYAVRQFGDSHYQPRTSPYDP